ncbi:MAG: nucleotidyltransferase family protein [Deferrisomatales bacterium]
MPGDLPSFWAVVLAGDRGPDDPLRQAAGVSAKALVPVGGRPMVLRVLDAVADARSVGRCVLCGPDWDAVEGEPALGERIGSDKVRWVPTGPTPSTSAWNGLKEVPEDVPALLTTADHALLTPEMVDRFCAEASASGCDVVAGVARHEVVARAYPETRRTVTRLRDGGYCGCNLFAFLTPRSREAARFWRRVEAQRKNPLRIVGTVGWIAVVRYLLGRLTLEEGLRRLSRAMGVRAGVVVLPFPEAAIDVDKVSDWELVERIVGKGGY